MKAEWKSVGGQRRRKKLFLGTRWLGEARDGGRRKSERFGRWICILIRNLLESFLDAARLSSSISFLPSRQIREVLLSESSCPFRQLCRDRLLILTSLRRISVFEALLRAVLAVESRLPLERRRLNQVLEKNKTGGT